MIQKGNYNLLENHLFILRTMKVNPELTIVRDIGTWNAESVEQLKIGITELFDWYKNNADSEEIPNFILFYLKHVIMYKVKKQEIKTCGAGNSYFSFSENKLIPCNRFKDQPDVISKIPLFVEMPKCVTCEIKSYCNKGCLYEHIQNNGPIDELCEIYKHIFLKIFDMIEFLKDNSKFIAILKKGIENG